MNSKEVCPFCKTGDTVLKNNLAYVRYDKYPVSQGHLLIIPFRHVSDYFELDNDEKSALYRLLDEGKELLIGEYQPDGFNVGINIGETAGQTIPHVHIHLIPRYKGDTNNPMGGVRGVIPEMKMYGQDS
jgi:diadenosine tetraphosphate (Ap4A) HIT family hydrolase